MSAKEEKIKEKLKQDPGNPVFAEFAEYLRRKKRTNEAFEVCYAGLTTNPGCHIGRLVLARLYWQHEWYPFAVRELARVYESFPDNSTLLRLIQTLDPTFSPLQPGAVGEQRSGNETLIAETVFDMGDVDLLED